MGTATGAQALKKSPRSSNGTARVGLLNEEIRGAITGRLSRDIEWHRLCQLLPGFGSHYLVIVYEAIHGPLGVTVTFYFRFNWLAFEIVVLTRLSSLAAVVVAYDSVFGTLTRLHPPQH